MKTPWTAAEDFLLVSLQAVLGNRWNEISRAFTGRSENAIKNRWNSKQRRRFLNDAKPRARARAAAADAAAPAPAAAVDFREALRAAFGSDPLEREAATQPYQAPARRQQHNALAHDP